MNKITLSYILTKAYQSLMGDNELAQKTAQKVINILESNQPEYLNTLEHQIQLLMEKADSIDVLQKNINGTDIQIEFDDSFSIRIFAKLDLTKLPIEYSDINKLAFVNESFNQMLKNGVDIAYLPTGSISNAMDNDFYSFLNVDKAFLLKKRDSEILNNLTVLQSILDINNNQNIQSALISFKELVVASNEKNNDVDEILILAKELSNNAIIIANEIFKLNSNNLNTAYIGSHEMKPYNMGCEHYQDIVVFIEKMRQQFFIADDINNSQLSFSQNKILNTIKSNSFNGVKDSMLLSIMEFMSLTYLLEYAKKYGWQVQCKTNSKKHEKSIFISIPQSNFALFNLSPENKGLGCLVIAFHITAMPFSLTSNGIAPKGIKTINSLNELKIIEIDEALNLNSLIIHSYWEKENPNNSLHNDSPIDWGFLSSNWHIMPTQNITSLIKQTTVLTNLVECAIYHANSTTNQENIENDVIENYNIKTEISFGKILKSIQENGLVILKQKVNKVDFYLLSDEDFDCKKLNEPMYIQQVDVNTLNQNNQSNKIALYTIENNAMIAELIFNNGDVVLRLYTKMSEFHNISQEKSMKTPLIDFALLFKQ